MSKRGIATCLFMVLAATAVSLAQNEPQVQNVTVTVTDRSERLFDEGTVEVTLISAPGYESGQTIGTEAVQFSVGDVSKPFPIRQGAADTKLLIQGDASKDPFKYQLSAKGPDGSRIVSKSVDVTSNTRHITLVAPDVTAPLTRMEMFGGLAFVVLAAVLAIATFFYWGFRRMLFNRRMEVHSAVPASRIIAILYLLVIIALALAAWTKPDLLSDRATSTYVGLCLIFFGLYGIGLLFMFFLTRARAARS